MVAKRVGTSMPRPKRTNTALPFIAEVNLRGKGCASSVGCAAHHKQLSTAVGTIPVLTFASAKTLTAALVKLLHDSHRLFAGQWLWKKSATGRMSRITVKQGCWHF